MKKLLIVGMIGAVALVALAKQTHVFSYASTAFSSVATATKNQIPTKFELERVRQEIAGLDGDINQMVKPIAEYKVVIEKMRKDIAKAESNIADKKKVLLETVEDLQGDPKHLVIDGKTYSVTSVRKQLERDTASLKQLEKSVRTQRQVLEAKELSLRATQEQLAKVISKKREYELRLAQLEAEEETLQIARIGSDVKIDSGRATHIENALANIEHRQQVEKTAVELQNGDLATVPLHERNRNPVDLQAIRNYLEGNDSTDKTASNK